MVDAILNITVHKGGKVINGIVDAVVGNTSLRIVVGTYLCRAVTGRDIMKWIEDKGYHLGNIMNAFRLTLVGEGKGPHMFDISAVLGKEETLRRIRRAVEVLK